MTNVFASRLFWRKESHPCHHGHLLRMKVLLMMQALQTAANPFFLLKAPTMELRWEVTLYNWPHQLRKENKTTEVSLPTSGNIRINRWTLWPEHASNGNSRVMQFCAKKQCQLTLCWEAQTSFHLYMKCCKYLCHSGWGTEMQAKIETLSNTFFNTALLVKTAPAQLLLKANVIH